VYCQKSRRKKLILAVETKKAEQNKATANCEIKKKSKMPPKN